MKPVHGLDLSLAVLADAEKRVAQQKQTIEHLRKQGHPTRRAENTLLRLERRVLHLQNHLEIMHRLVSPDPYLTATLSIVSAPKRGRKVQRRETPPRLES